MNNSNKEEKKKEVETNPVKVSDNINNPATVNNINAVTPNVNAYNNAMLNEQDTHYNINIV